MDQPEKRSGAEEKEGTPAPAQSVETCEICGSTALEEIRCKVVCRNCRTILRTCSDM